jgi:Ca2+:H+ antiporter
MHSRLINRSDLFVLVGSATAVVLAGVTRYARVGAVVPFVVSAVAVALLASLVGRSVEQLGDRFGAGATGVLQGALGNLPELFIGYFALRAGLVDLVRAAIIGSVLANLLLVLGLAFVVGGVRHGVQVFSTRRARTTTALLFLATGALVLPSVAAYVHTPAEPHEQRLSVVVSVVLLVLFALSLFVTLRRGHARPAPAAVAAAAPAAEGVLPEEPAPMEEPRWPVRLAVAMLALAALASALVSEWFVYALQPAIHAVGFSQAFAGLIVVAIASNAVENVVGIQLAARNHADYAVSVIVNSPLQVALVLGPALVLLSFTTATALTLVFAPMLVIAAVLSVLAVTLIIVDGESNWLEGAMLIALYLIIATVFWWG